MIYSRNVLVFIITILIYLSIYYTLINLLFYLPTAVICTLLRKKQHTLQIKPILPAMIAGCSAAFLFSIISSGWNLILMKKLLGILLIGIGIRELIYRPRNAK